MNINSKIVLSVILLFIFLFPAVSYASDISSIYKSSSSDSYTFIQETDGCTYCYSESGKLLKGWQTIDGNRYYFEKSTGKMSTGWVKSGSYKYFFSDSGIMQSDKMISKNKYVNSKGHLVKKSQIYYFQKPSMKKLKTRIADLCSSYGGDWSVYLKNLDSNRFFVINNKARRPASLIKLFNMGTTYELLEKKAYSPSSAISDNLYKMITVSSNDSYNYLLYKNGNGNTFSGFSRANEFCRKYKYNDTVTGSTLSPSKYRQHFKQYNKSSVKDCGHILEDIYRKNLVSSSASNKMLNLLKNQKCRKKIPAGLPSGTECANKTGELNSMQHDAAIVFSEGADYILVIMSEGDKYAVKHIKKNI